MVMAVKRRLKEMKIVKRTEKVEHGNIFFKKSIIN